MTQIYRNETSTHLLGTVEEIVTLHTKEPAFRADPTDGRPVRIFLREADAASYVRGQ